MARSPHWQQVSFMKARGSVQATTRKKWERVDGVDAFHRHETRGCSGKPKKSAACLGMRKCLEVLSRSAKPLFYPINMYPRDVPKVV